LSQKSSVWQNHPFVMGLICVVIALGFVVAVTPSVQTIDTAGMPTWEVELVGVLQLIVNVVPTSVLAGFGWTLFGYIRFKAGDNEVDYDLTKMAQTVAWFTGLITPLTYGLGTSGLPLGTAITTGIMALKSVLNQLTTAMQQQSTPNSSSADSTVQASDPSLPAFSTAATFPDGLQPQGSIRGWNILYDPNSDAYYLQAPSEGNIQGYFQKVGPFSSMLAVDAWTYSNPYPSWSISHPLPPHVPKPRVHPKQLHQ
jgi:hypothetical protein